MTTLTHEFLYPFISFDKYKTCIKANTDLMSDDCILINDTELTDVDYTSDQT